MDLLGMFTSALAELEAVGDVVAESRGGKENFRLTEVYRDLVETQLRSHPDGRRITSKEIKLQNKSDNIAGLQLADLIAAPARRATMERFRGKPSQPGFGAVLMQLLLDQKFRREPISGEIEKWGFAMLP